MVRLTADANARLARASGRDDVLIKQAGHWRTQIRRAAEKQMNGWEGERTGRRGMIARR